MIRLDESIILYAKLHIDYTCSIKVLKCMFYGSYAEMSGEQNTNYTFEYRDYDNTIPLIIDYGDGVHELVVGNTTGETVSSAHKYYPGDYIVRIIGNKKIVRATLFDGLYTSYYNIQQINGKITYLYLNPSCFIDQSTEIDSKKNYWSIYWYSTENRTLKYMITLPTNVYPNILDYPECPYGNLFIGYIESSTDLIDRTLQSNIGVVPKTNEKYLEVPENFTQTVNGKNSSYINSLCSQYGWIHSTKHSYMNSGLLFDSTGEANAVNNKLNGAICYVPDVSSANKYDVVYDTPKTISKFLIAGGVGKNATLGGSTYLDTVVETYPSQKKLSFINQGGGDSMSQAVNIPISIKIIYSDGTFDTDYATINNHIWTCFLEGTLITLYDGSQKKIEDIKYSDLILVYDFIQGKLTYSHPYFIKQARQCIRHLEFNLENGEKFTIVGDHGVYDCKNKKLVWITESNYKDIDLNNFAVWYRDSKNNLIETKVSSINLVEEEKDFYTLMTAGTQTCFTNNVLTCGSMIWQFLGKIKENHQFDLTNFNYIKEHPEIQYSYDRFLHDYGMVNKAIYYGSIDDILIGGLNAGLQYGDITKEQMDIQTRNALWYFWPDAKGFEKNEHGFDIFYATLIYKDGHIETKEYISGATVELPFSEKGWYNIVDTNVYTDSFTLNVSTTLEEI